MKINTQFRISIWPLRKGKHVPNFTHASMDCCEVMKIKQIKTRVEKNFTTFFVGEFINVVNYSSSILFWLDEFKDGAASIKCFFLMPNPVSQSW